MSHPVIVISGASRGIGLAIAQTLYSEGYCLSLGMRDVDVLAAYEFTQDQSRVLVTHYDAHENRTAKHWIDKTIEKSGRIEALINCAGIFLDCTIEDFNEKNLDSVWQVNTKAPIVLTEAAWSYLKTSGKGRVINIISLAGKLSYESFAYSISKHAFLAFTHSIRQAGWQYGIRATALCPGWVNTDMAEGCQIESELLTQPEDIASIIKMLLTLPNSTSIAEMPINCQNHQLF